MESTDTANPENLAASAQGATCAICPHACHLKEGQRGLCQARVARAGKVICENYGRITSMALDPIEKKPFARFLPGARILSIGSYGCSMNCAFCQNASIAQTSAEGARWRDITPEELIETALDLREQGNAGLAYTYNEPLVSFEYVLDCARLAHEHGLVNAIVSNGMINEGPLAELAPYLDAANIDLKAFTERFYREHRGSLECVKRTIETLAASPTCHLEVTTLVIPGENDTPEEIEALASWLAALSPDIPLHISRFFPRNRMADRSATDVRDVYALADVARTHLRHVYTGNC